MSLLARSVRREVLGNAALGLALFTFVLFMQDLGRALETVVEANSWSLLAVLADVLPAALVFTLPMAVLVGILIALGRMGVDNELTALRASGVGSRPLLRPLLEVTGLGLSFSLVLTLWWAPAARRQLDGLTARLAAAGAVSAVQPRVFFEPQDNPNWVVYTGDTAEGGKVWRQVMVADMKIQDSPELILASQGRVVARVGSGADVVQIHLVEGAQYKVDPLHPSTSVVSSFRTVDIPFAVPEARRGTAPLAELSLGALERRARFAPDWRQARVELHRRLALAFACLALALLGIALGLRGGRGGKAGGLVLTLLLVLAYYLIFILGLGLARQGRLPPFVGAWAANFIFLGAGTWALLRLDRVPRQLSAGSDPVAWLRTWMQRRSQAQSRPHSGVGPSRWMPSLLEGYVVREFLGYTGLLLAGFLVLVLVFTLFELIGSILQHHIGPGVVLEYLLYFSPQMLYMMIPVAILVGVLLTFGLMSKSNEVTAMKATGISVYRLLLPVLAVALALGALQFGLDATWLPAFNQKQDALHALIKGQPPQTFRNPEHKWVFGQANDIYYFSFFDPGRNQFADISVFQFDPADFQLTRRIFARQARWDDSIQGWVFTNGWARDFAHQAQSRFQPFLVASFPGLPEHPGYFTTDSRLGTQMTYGELRRYVHNLSRSGYDVARLSITLAKKLAYPLITVIMALLAFPFALSVGRRGTVAGVSVGIAVAIAYWSTSSLLEALGNLNQLPAAVAAWTPDVLFLGLGVWLLLRVPT